MLGEEGEDLMAEAWEEGTCLPRLCPQRRLDQYALVRSGRVEEKRKSVFLTIRCKGR